jgi:hypothetical protein
MLRPKSAKLFLVSLKLLRRPVDLFPHPRLHNGPPPAVCAAQACEWSLASTPAAGGELRQPAHRIQERVRALGGFCGQRGVELQPLPHCKTSKIDEPLECQGRRLSARWPWSADLSLSMARRLHPPDLFRLCGRNLPYVAFGDGRDDGVLPSRTGRKPGEMSCATGRWTTRQTLSR